MDEALVAIEKLKINASMVQIYRKNSNTLKIMLPNQITIMKFNASEEECEKFQNQNEGYIELNIVGKCHQNEWMGKISPQIFIEDYEIIGEGKYLF